MNMTDLKFIETEISMPLMKLPVRTVAVSLSRANVLICPGSKVTDEQYKSLPQIHEIVANNGFHNAGVPKAIARFPGARVWGVPGSRHPHVLTHESWPYAEELPMVLIEGFPRINEAVFFHKKSRTLIVADLCFNLVHAQGLGAKLILNLFGTHKRFAMSRLWLPLLKDRSAALKSLERVFAFDFDNIVMAHGEPIVGRAKGLLQSALKERGL